MTFTKNKEYPNSTIKAPRNSAKTFLKFAKTSKRHGKHFCSIPVVKLWAGQSCRQDPHPMQCFWSISWTDICEQSWCSINFFKNVRRNKKFYTKMWIWEKYPRQIQHPVIYLNMELLVRIINDFKLWAIFAKRSILDASQVLINKSTNRLHQIKRFFTNNKR